MKITKKEAEHHLHIKIPLSLWNAAEAKINSIADEGGDINWTIVVCESLYRFIENPVEIVSSNHLGLRQKKAASLSSRKIRP